jgi:hypothetical protein
MKIIFLLKTDLAPPRAIGWIGFFATLGLMGQVYQPRNPCENVIEVRLPILAWLWTGQRQRFELFLLVCIQQRLDLGFRVFELLLRRSVLTFHLFLEIGDLFFDDRSNLGLLVVGQC